MQPRARAGRAWDRGRPGGHQRKAGSPPATQVDAQIAPVGVVAFSGVLGRADTRCP
jgi:hypothetical protein